MPKITIPAELEKISLGSYRHNDFLIICRSFVCKHLDIHFYNAPQQITITISSEAFDGSTPALIHAGEDDYLTLVTPDNEYDLFMSLVNILHTTFDLKPNANTTLHYSITC